MNDDCINSNEADESESLTDTTKNISFGGTLTKYEMKKALKIKSERKKRVNAFKWSDTCLNWDYQKELLANIINPEFYTKGEINHYNSKEISINIRNKLSAYKQQDILKKMTCSTITFEDTINLLIESNLVCHYCSEQTYLIYQYVREPKQWSLDRINNGSGHVKGNVIICCLKCNLHRRTTNKDAFFFTKNMVITKCNDQENIVEPDE